MNEEIKRFDCEGCSGYCYGGYHMADVGEYGDYVKAEDFDRIVSELKAERDALRADAERLDFVMRNIAGASLRRIAGELADTGNLDAFRAAIDSKKANKEEA